MKIFNNTEKSMIKGIIIVPFFIIIIFTLASYYFIKLHTIPKNEAIWENKLNEQYLEEQKKLIVDESEKIYNFISDERKEEEERLSAFLMKQNTILRESSTWGILPNILDNEVNFEILKEEELKIKIPNLYEKIQENNSSQGFIFWMNDKFKYEGYYKYYENTVYITYVDAQEFLKKSRREVLKKVMRMKFPEHNYIFVLGYDGIIYGHHKKEVVENPRLKDIDPRRWENLNNIVHYARKNGRTFIEYETGTKINPENFEEKISYLIPDDEWGIVIGFGLSKRIIEERIKKEKFFRNELIKNIIMNLFFVAVLYITFQSFIMYFFGNRFTKKFLERIDEVTFEKEKLSKLNYEQNKLSASKDAIINDLVPIAQLNKDLLFKNCSKKFSELFEVNEIDICNESLLGSLNDKDKIVISEFVKSMNREIELKDTLFKSFNGNDVWLTVKIKKEIKGSYGELLGFTLIGEEVGEKVSYINKYKKEQEKNLEQEQLILQQSKLAAIGTTVDSIAHQWKQPLAVLNGEVYELIKKVRKHKTEDRTVDLKYMQDVIERIEGTINLLSETIIAFNTFYDSSDDASVVDITKLIKDTFKILIPSTSSNTYEIEYDVEDGVYAFGGKTMYQQVILTLIHNSLDAFKENKIKNRKFKVIVKNEEEYNLCTIQDNAGGIKEDVISKIFELNFSTKKKDKLGNSGLGLYLASVVLKEKFEDGEITAKNVDGGAAFTIRTKNLNLDELN